MGKSFQQYSRMLIPYQIQHIYHVERFLIISMENALIADIQSMLSLVLIKVLNAINVKVVIEVLPSILVHGWQDFKKKNTLMLT